MGIREVQKQRRNQAILEAGLDAFVERGFSGTRISDIATRANMSIGLLFHYYDNTEKLYEALVAIGLRGTEQYLPTSTDIDALTYFENYTQFFLREVHKDSFTAKMCLLMSLAIRSPDTPESVKKMLKRMNTVTEFSKFIQKGQEQGTVKPGDPLALANTYLVCLVGLARQIAVEPSTPMPEPNWIVDIIRKRG